MPMPDPAEASLINDAQFLDELERFEHRDQHIPDPGLEPHEYGDALESGLPMHAGGLQADPSHHERAQVLDAYAPPDDQPAPVIAEKSIPFVAAALVLVACLTVGAATAALVFHDRIGQITSTRTATR